MKKLLFIIVFACFLKVGYGQVPPGYYDGTEGLSGEELRFALFEIIDGHDEQTYASLWTHFQSTDKKNNGKVWDMYSDIPGGTPAYSYDFVVDQCGNYSGEGDCYNREHSFPKSWFNDAAPMVTDLFHIYPTDGYVNGMRSNYPFGEVGSATWTSSNGSKVGNSAFPGYSGTVFEPVDEYKGDFARSYFYMLTRYLDVASIWSSPMLSGGDFSPWAEDLLIQWHEEDPVSDKELSRNNEVHDIQSNRNPYIDHAEWVGEIWGTATFTGEETRSSALIRYSYGQIRLLNAENEEGVVALSNLYGQVLERWDSKPGVFTLPVNLKQGIYFVTYSDNKQNISRKIFLQ